MIDDLSNPAEQEVAQREAGLAALQEYGVTLDKSVLLAKTQTEIEQATYPWNPNRRLYGAVPHFAERDQIIGHFAGEAQYFAKHYQPGNADGKKPAWMDASYAEGALLFEMKFGQRLSNFCEQILAPYPDLGKQGKEISIFGLSGAGKSTALEALREAGGSSVIEMDSDTIRYNLLAKMVADVEQINGATLNQVRNELLHNAISGPLYFAVNHIAKELKTHGYTVVRSSTMANEGSDLTIYLEHPTVNPELLSLTGDAEQDKAVFDSIARQLAEVTESRIKGPDTYAWESATTELDFRKMQPVTVRVPEQAHASFVKNIRAYLGSHLDIVRINNPLDQNSENVKRNFVAQISPLFNA